MSRKSGQPNPRCRSKDSATHEPADTGRSRALALKPRSAQSDSEVLPYNDQILTVGFTTVDNAQLISKATTLPDLLRSMEWRYGACEGGTPRG